MSKTASITDHGKSWDGAHLTTSSTPLWHPDHSNVATITGIRLTSGPARATGATPVQLVPERQEVAPALSLFGANILSAVAFKSGALRLVFGTGQHLNVKPHAQYEAWSARDVGTLRVVCQPGGGLAVWI
ncbi:DUF6188 family protein [Plantactinospora solaniradicis]|uniref:DUF6188 family protein n=1 Tax=Plantactinospora solaniradicis TaxID=1723736 RepID=A0ABW1KIB5_9ACTN